MNPQLAEADEDEKLDQNGLFFAPGIVALTGRASQAPSTRERFLRV